MGHIRASSLIVTSMRTHHTTLTKTLEANNSIRQPSLTTKLFIDQVNRQLSLLHTGHSDLRIKITIS